MSQAINPAVKRVMMRDIQNNKVGLGHHAVGGWVKTHRRSKRVAFIELSDGTSMQGLQLVVDPNLPEYQAIETQLATGAALLAEGELVESPAAGQKYEFQVSSITLAGASDAETYPLQKKGHTLEFLRENLHLRPRSNTFNAVFRIRSVMSMLVHEFFQHQDFIYVHAPIITAADCEGAGEMFRVSALDPNRLPLENGKVDFSKDFFKEEAKLTVSGQLEAEAFACAFSNVYTFGPTFRAENSNTTRHLSEFWMIEPEMAFYDIAANATLAERFVKFLIAGCLERCDAELQFLHEREWAHPGLRDTLVQVVEQPFRRMDYCEAVEILLKSGKEFEFPVSWGIDLQSEHERYLTDEVVKGPLTVMNYPKQIKAFYMRLNEDQKTVAAMDVLVPRLGEIIGGSQREERLEVLEARMAECDIHADALEWYLDLRRFGTVPHAGFGLGFERMVMYVTGMQNIRDVIPFPRCPGLIRN
jgi:asparaginyl-tRNA synthetase